MKLERGTLTRDPVNDVVPDVWMMYAKSCDNLIFEFDDLFGFRYKDVSKGHGSTFSIESFGWLHVNRNW